MTPNGAINLPSPRDLRELNPNSRRRTSHVTRPRPILLHLARRFVYHFMFGPDYTAGCATCSATADSFNGVLAHLQARDVTMICISHAPLEKLLDYRRRMGWSFNWASSYESDFNFDFGVSAADEAAHEVPLLEANE